MDVEEAAEYVWIWGTCGLEIQVLELLAPCDWRKALRLSMDGLSAPNALFICADESEAGVS